MDKLQVINNRIESIGKAEKVTKKELGTVSRELLDYVVLDESWDSDAINRLMAVLTPMNRTTALHFFAHFTPFVVEDGRFGGMPKAKKAKAEAKMKSGMLCLEFLEDETKNIWTWAADNLKVEKKEIDWGKRVTSAINSAMDDEKGGLSLPEVMEAVLATGMSVDDLNKALAILSQEVEEKEAA